LKTASSTIKSESFDVLNQIADIMKRNLAHKLTISGHTDSVGSSSNNLKLSENRAKACYDYLVSKGIKPYRMNYKGYGESVPIADNKYKAGRDKNRRVEFLLYIE
jgi:OOP family OmpA-OmpF porin